MALPIVPIAMALAQLVPTALKYFGAGDASVNVAEKVVGIAQTVTGASTPEEALTRMRQDAEAQRQFELALKAQETDLEKAYLADIQSARARDVQLVQITGKNRRGDVLAYAAIGALLINISLLMFMEVPATSRDLLLVTLGALVAIVKDVYSFEFGSSKDSQRNAQAVADALKAS